MIKKCLVTIVVICAFFTTYSQCENDSAQLDAIQKKYGVQFVDLEKQAANLGKVFSDSTDTGFKSPKPAIKTRVTWKDQRYVYDIPSVTMKARTFSYGVPKVTLKTKSMSIPASRTVMVNQNVLGAVIKVPQTTNYMKRVETKIPEIKMSTTTFKTKIPEYTKSRKEIILKIPEFTLVNPLNPKEPDTAGLANATNALTAASDGLNQRAEALVKEQNQELRAGISSYFTCIELTLRNELVKSQREYESGIIEVTKGINDCIEHGIDPTKLKAEDGSSVNLLSVKTELTESYQFAKKEIEAALADLKKQQDEALAELQ